MLTEIVLLITLTIDPGVSKPQSIEFGTVYDTMEKCEAALDRSMKDGFKFYMMDKALHINSICIERPIANQAVINQQKLDVLIQADCNEVNRL